jgi:hypothetical protein
MYGIEVILTLILTRLVFPIGTLLLIGEWIRRREANYWFRS